MPRLQLASIAGPTQNSGESSGQETETGIMLGFIALHVGAYLRNWSEVRGHMQIQSDTCVYASMHAMRYTFVGWIRV